MNHKLSWLKSGLHSKQLIHLQQQREKAGRRKQQKDGLSLTANLFCPSGKAEGSSQPATISPTPCPAQTWSLQPLSPFIPRGYCHHSLQPRVLWRWQSQEYLLLRQFILNVWKVCFHLHLMNMCSAYSGITFRSLFYIVLMSFTALSSSASQTCPFGRIQIHSISPCATNADSNTPLPYSKE